MSGREGDWLAVADTVPQTWTNAARRTSARAASVPTPTALSSASVLRDTAPAQTSPPVSVRGPALARSLSPLPPGLPYLSPSLPPLCCFLLPPFLRLPPPPSNSALPSLSPQPVLLSLLATPLPARRFPHLTARLLPQTLTNVGSGARPCAGPSVVKIPRAPTAVSETATPATTQAPRAPVTVRPLPRPPRRAFLMTKEGLQASLNSPHRWCKQATSVSLHCL